MSGLNAARRIRARRLIKRAAMTGYRNRNRIHYTQGSSRWSGITKRKRSYKGQYPVWADCSAFATWCYWDGCLAYIRKRIVGDFVNGASWRAGYTGTMVKHGKRIERPRLVGDLVFYGGTKSVPAHVAIYVGSNKVVSHGSESGPHLLAWNYRPVNQVRRYL